MQFYTRLDQLLLIVFSTIFTFSPGFTQNDFTRAFDLTGVWFADAAWGDYDGDGDLDLVVIGQDSLENPVTKIYLNNGNQFVAQDFGLPEMMNGAVLWGDYDNDNDLDLIASGFSTENGNMSRIYRNDNGNLVWEDSITLEDGFRSKAALGDYDNDGDLDLFLGGHSVSIGLFSFIYENRAGNFVFDRELSSFGNGIGGNTASWQDTDNDGDLDLLFPGDVFVNLSDAAFERADALSFIIRDGNTNEAKWAEWADYDADGDLDLLLTGSFDPAAFFENDGSGGLMADQSANDSMPEDNAVIAAWGDYDNNGLFDILFGANVPGDYFGIAYQNNSDGTFSDTPNRFGDLRVEVVKWGDYDADGDLDFFICGRTEALVPFARIYRSDILNSNTAPATPGNLRHTFPNAQEVLLQWDPATDAETPAAGLTYNIRVGTTPGGTEISSPMANLATGQRLIPEQGNTGHNLSWKITGLEPGGAYYWSVQSIDQGFRASAFGAEASFTMQDSLFTHVDAGLPGVRNSISQWADYDNDGDLDIFLFGETGNGNFISDIYRNDGNDSFSRDASASLDIPTRQNITAAFTDYNNDGLIDVFIAGYDNQQYHEPRSDLYLNQGNSRFERAYVGFSGIIGFNNAAAMWSDFNRDGLQDLLVTGDSDSGLVTMVFNQGENGNLNRNYAANIAGVRNGSVAAGDYDRDGFPDLLISGTVDAGAGGLTRVYHNEGNGSFTDIDLSIFDVDHGQVGWLDFNGDGYLDVVVTGNFGADQFFFYRNDQQGGFTLDANMYNNFNYGEFSAFAFVDYDNDGKLDLLYSGYDAELLGGRPFLKALNNYLDIFALDIFSSRGLPAFFKGDIAPGDYDADGRMDFLISGETADGSFVSRILRNTHRVVNTSPSMPVLLPAQVSQNDVRLHWLPADDVETLVPLRYNLRVGTAPGRADILSAMTDSLTGSALLPGFSNAAHDTSITLYNLPYETTFYWSVQAIDNGLKASAFAVEGTFETPLPPFKDNQVQITGLSFGSIAWGDYSDDGNFDFVQTGVGSGFKTIFYRNALGYIIEDVVPTSLVTGSNRGVGVWGDYDHDGDLDLFVSGDSESGGVLATVFEYYNGGSFAFNEDAAATTVMDGVFESDAAWGDLDNDGDLDLVVSGVSISGTSYLRIYKNEQGQFTRADSLLDILEGSVDVGDYDNDGDLDILATGKANGEHQTVIFENTLAGFGIDTEASAILDGVYQSDADFGDFDNDGDLDILLTGNRGDLIEPNPITRLYRNTGGGNFEIHRNFTALYRSEVEWGDYDNDGFLDFILLGQPAFNGRSTLLYRNIDGVNFELDEKSSKLLLDVSLGSAAWGDFDDDGDLDLLLQGNGIIGRDAKLYVNTFAAANTPPAAPTGLSAMVRDNDVLLRWNPANDDHTPDAAITYNLRIGSRPDTMDVKSPMAREDGWRKVAEWGNVGQDTSFVITGLDTGQTYYWTVQAIDQAFLGSPFAGEQSFTTDYNLPPRLETLRTNGPNEKRINLVLLSEGYTAPELDDFLADAERIANGIFAFEPFLEYEPYFNVHAIAVASHETGSAHPSQNAFPDTYFSSSFEMRGADNFIDLPQEGFERANALLDDILPTYDLVMLIINDNTYGGSAVPWRDRAMAFVSTSNVMITTAIHELGHTVGLGDEYEFPVDLPLFEYPNVTAENAAGNIRWQHWFEDANNDGEIDVPIPTVPAEDYPGVIGLFEGANYNRAGWYRPRLSCKMRDNFTDESYCEVCKEWLIKTLYGYRWTLPGLPEPYHRTRPLKPIEAYSPALLDQVLNNAEELELSITPLAPANHALLIQWYINDEPIAGATEPRYTVRAGDLGNGSHRVKVVVRDATDWVKQDLAGFLSDTTAWEFNVVGIVSVRDKTELLPSSYALNQNYPNPFNPSTEILFALPDAGHVLIKIYNARGQEVITLIDREMPAGYHSVTWHANAGTGVYFYLLEAGSYRQIRKMLLIQ